MPTFSQMYGTSTIIGNLDIEPQTGWQYEMGVKHIKGIHAWRAAVFYMDIKNNISASHTGGSTTYVNEDFKNLGLELSHDIKLDNGFNFTTGVTFSNPKIRRESNGWVSKYGRYQINFGVGYKKDKFNAQIMGNFLGDRHVGNSAGTVSTTPLFVTSLHLAYKPSKGNEVYLNMDNLFNRRAAQTSSSAVARYYQTPRNFEIGYKFSF